MNIRCVLLHSVFIWVISLLILTSCKEKIPSCNNNLSTEEEITTDISVEGQITEGNQIENTSDEPEGETNDEGIHENQINDSFWPQNTPFQLTYEIVRIYPHDPTAFTQGLIWVDGVLYESTGLYNRSSVRKVDLESGKPLINNPLPTEFNGILLKNLFAEGLTVLPPSVYQLTWKNGICFVYSMDLEFLNAFQYEGEGWGLTHYNNTLIMSNGTEYLRFINPDTFIVKKEVRVLDHGKPVYKLNELEYIEGYICANIWQEDYIVVIHPERGEVVGKILLYGLKQKQGNNGADVLNGIAYLPEKQHLLVTGKLWDSLFEIKLIPQ